MIFLPPRLKRKQLAGAADTGVRQRNDKIWAAGFHRGKLDALRAASLLRKITSECLYVVSGRITELPTVHFA